MDRMTVLIAAALLAIALAIFHVGSSFSHWRDPDYAADSIGYNLAYYLGEQLVSEGLFYPQDDLDDPLLASRTIVLAHTVNENTTREVTRKLLYLNALDSESPIEFYISTQGGWYDAAFTLIDVFHAIKAPVNTICVGGCYSAGLLLMTAGTGVRTAYANAHFSAHIAYGDESDHRPFARQPDRVNTYLQTNTRLPRDWFPLEDDRNYYFTAEQALEYRIIDRITGGS